MIPQILTIDPTGGVAGLQRKPGQGFDLRTLGRAKIERASEIVWDEAAQKWIVHVLVGRFAGITLAAGHFLDWIGCIPEMGVVDPDTTIVAFAEYDDAVQAEVMFLESLRGKVGSL